uniref:t-SNARE coiled-coil homology domain-containing protein n=1 Tax=Bicosoecida sp. CB-2014 TaxID=1486930 RepID=A0A7S1G274_9STRA
MGLDDVRDKIAKIGSSKDTEASRRDLERKVVTLRDLCTRTLRALAAAPSGRDAGDAAATMAYTKVANDFTKLAKSAMKACNAFDTLAAEHPMETRRRRRGKEERGERERGGDWGAGGGAGGGRRGAPSPRGGDGDGGVGGEREMEHPVLRGMVAEDEAAINARLIAEREEEIHAIARDTHTVRDMVDDVAYLVGTQEQNIERIADNAERAAADTRRGVKELEKAQAEHEETTCAVQ